MHRRGIAHLDLRPEVILLQDDHLRLADFGQSRLVKNGSYQSFDAVYFALKINTTYIVIKLVIHHFKNKIRILKKISNL